MADKITRREVIVGSAALVAALHVPTHAFGAQQRKPGKPLIKSMRLQTAENLAKMEEFYCGTLGFEKVKKSNEELTVTAGATAITFLKTNTKDEGPLTHFAFNIPQNKIRQVLDWTQKRIEVIPAWGDLADPNYPKEIVHFRHWNAHSVFFWDPAYNLLEFIARHDLANNSTGAFSTKDILCVSEIGLAVKNPVSFAKFLNTEMKVPAYPRGTDPSFAMGDENGLLLCLTDGLLWGGHTKTPKHWRTYETEVEIQGSVVKTVKTPGYPFTLRVTA